jgi:hypothetical protein
VLHVGHGKTGTSVIQSALVLNKEELLRRGFVYPSHRDEPAARRGEITSGNGELLFESTFRFDDEVNYIFSSEWFFERLLEENRFSRLVQDCGRKIKVVLYTRDVFELLFSAWVQRVKRSGEVLYLDEFLLKATTSSEDVNPFFIYKKIQRWLDMAEEYNCECIVRNYSRWRANIVEIFFRDAMNVERLDFDILMPNSRTVNRSLTLLECEFQRVFNNVVRGSSRFISDALVNKLPNLPVARLRCSSEAYDAVCYAIRPSVEQINSRIALAEAVLIESRASVVVDQDLSQVVFSPEQMEVLAVGLRELFSRLKR